MHLLVIILLFLFFGLIYIYIRFISSLSPNLVVRLLFLIFVSGVLALFFLGFYLKSRGFTGGWADSVTWVSGVGMGFLSFLLTFLTAADFLYLIWWGAAKVFGRAGFGNPRPLLPSPERRVFFSATASAVLAGGAGFFTGAGIYFAKKSPEVKRVSVFVENLADGLEGFTIAQITDIHLSPTCKIEFMAEVVERVNRLKPDMIALTGDLADGTVAVAGKDAKPLGALRAPFGKYYVTGNHEYYYNAEKWIEKVESLGFKALINSNEIIRVKGANLMVAGVSDYRARNFIDSHNSDPLRAVKSDKKADLKILLAHQPKSVFSAAKAGFDIQLSGHTHGGQFIPWQLAIGLDQPYLAGLYRHENLQLYVSRGTGYWGPPLRMAAPSEITLLRLEKI